MKLPRILAAGFVSLVLLSCSTVPKKKAPAVAPVDAKREFQRIQVDVAAGADKKAAARLRALIGKNKGSDVADDATLQLAKIYFKQGNYPASYQTFNALIESDVFSANEAEAVTGAIRCLTKMGRLDEAFALSARGLKIPGLSDTAKLEVYRARFTVANALNDRVESLRALGFIFAKDPRPDVRQASQSRGTEMVNAQLSEAELEKVVGDADLTFVRAPAALKLGSLRLREKNLSAARDLFSGAREYGRGTPVETQAQNYLNQLESRDHADAYTIGAVLPLSGRHAPIAQKALQGAQLGLGIYSPTGERSRFRLAVIDSEGTPEGARKAVERLVTEDNVLAVIGSLLSKTAFAVAAKTEELGVPSFALSQKSGLTDAGNYTFRNAVTSETQVRELVRIAINQLNIKRFAILFPNEPYGVEYANIFWDEVLARGGSISGAQPYSTHETDFRGPIKRLVGTYYLDDRKVEYENRVRNYFKEQTSARQRGTVPDDLLPPIVDFEALFIPDSPKAVGQIAPMLAYQGVSNVRLLGTNVWNSAELPRRGQRNVERALFVDLNLDQDPAFKNSKFFRDYVKTFGEEPGLFESQGYEVGLLLRQMIERGEHTRVGLAQALAQLKTVDGVTGPMTMTPQHELQRPLTAFTVRDNAIVAFAPENEAPAPRVVPARLQPRKATKK